MPKRANKKARNQPKRVRKRPTLLSMNRKSSDAAIYTAAKVEDMPRIDNKFFDEVACPSQELFEPSDAESSDSEWVEETSSSTRRKRKLTEQYAQYKENKK